MIYKIEFIKGLHTFAVEDLKQKLSDQYSIINQNETSIIFESNIDDIDAFRTLRTALHIQLLEDNKVLVERNLFRKSWRKFMVPAGINPTLAYALCKLADLKDTDILMDPFCGGGTIPITAILDFNVAKVLASDISSKAIDYTKKNLNEAQINKSRYSIFISDIQRLKIQKEYLDKIVTNMPFGIRAGKHQTNISIYKTFINFCYSSLKKDGRVVAFTTEKTLLVEAMENKFEIIKEVKIAQGGLYPSIFLLKKII